MRAVLLFLCACATACGGAPPPSSTPPTAPADNDPSFTVNRLSPWYLIGNDLTPGQEAVEIQVLAPSGTEFVDYWIDDQPGARLHKTRDDFRTVIPIEEIPPGDHRILLAADGSEVAFAERTFSVSHPLYVVVSTDWDGPNPTDLQLELQNKLHEEHEELIITHFVGPYTFTDPTMTGERIRILTDWLTGLRDTQGDEIGVHIHPFCNFVDTTDVQCRHAPSTVYDQGDTTGYTVMCSAYTEDEFTRLLLAADALFDEHGLGKPTSFRAGGWTADITTLRALEAAGYVADTSALNWARMEEWNGVQNGVLYNWNKENWATIGDTSQPYYPSNSNLLGTGEDAIGLLEVPDNGIMVDYVTTEEMIDIFKSNWDGSGLAAPVAYSIGYHPTGFDQIEQARLLGALDHVDRFLASEGRGPVVYARLSDLVRVWKPAGAN